MKILIQNTTSSHHSCSQVDLFQDNRLSTYTVQPTEIATSPKDKPFHCKSIFRFYCSKMMPLSLSLFLSMICFSQLVESSVISHTGDATAHRLVKRATLALREYSDFQISTGTSGSCKEKAALVFLSPFRLTESDLTRIKNPIDFVFTQEDLNNCKTMTRAASAADASFTQAITTAGTVNDNAGQVRELKHGKLCNKVLKQTGDALRLRMEAKLRAADDGRTAKLSEAILDLKESIRKDREVKGQKMISFLDVGKTVKAPGSSGSGTGTKAT
ncbi:hypothetical protein MJO29_002756 [Puccinia striiformis f. sp. tritici]|nr:hypothetical protein MJO29_002756 [Puccinia striiformis f. sp. tritici]